MRSMEEVKNDKVYGKIFHARLFCQGNPTFCVLRPSILPRWQFCASSSIFSRKSSYRGAVGAVVFYNGPLSWTVYKRDNPSERQKKGETCSEHCKCDASTLDSNQRTSWWTVMAI